VQASDQVRATARGAFVAKFDEGRPLRYETLRCASLFRREPMNELLSRAGAVGQSRLLARVLTLELALRTVDAATDELPPATASRSAKALGG
jgi:hypothetical protein